MAQATDNALTTSEQHELAAHEKVIERGLGVVYKVAAALLAIREKKLYRADYDTFKSYVEQRWDITEQRAYQLLDAAQIRSQLENSTTVEVLPTSERQTRPLACLPENQQSEVWTQAVETAPRDGNGQPKVTGKHVQQVVNQRKNPNNISLVFTGNVEWNTPSEYIGAAREALGGIDLDPASNHIAQKTVRAERYFTKLDDGLAHDWFGTVWLNPPYRMPDIQRFVQKLLLHVGAGDVPRAILLTNNATDAKWWHDAADAASVVLFTRGRISFLTGTGEPGNPTNGQTLFYFGDNPDHFVDTFKKYGRMMVDQPDAHPDRTAAAASR